MPYLTPVKREVRHGQFYTLGDRPEAAQGLAAYTPQERRPWQKKVRGKLFYFGTDADAAVAEWLRVKDYLLAGNEPPAKDALPADDEGMRMGELCDRLLQPKAVQRDSGELSPIT